MFYGKLALIYCPTSEHPIFEKYLINWRNVVSGTRVVTWSKASSNFEIRCTKCCASLQAKVTNAFAFFPERGRFSNLLIISVLNANGKLSGSPKIEVLN